MTEFVTGIAFALVATGTVLCILARKPRRRRRGHGLVFYYFRKLRRPGDRRGHDH